MNPRGLLVALIALIILGIAVVVIGRSLVQPPPANPPTVAACSQILPLVDKQIAAHPGCADTADGQACYVNSMLQATFSNADAAAGHPFAAPGDLAAVNNLASIRSVPAGVDSSQWGVAKMVIFAAVPNTLGGVPVTFILYGDSQLTNADSEATDAMAASGPDAYPLRSMKAFYFETGLSPQANCADLNSPDALPGGALLIDQSDGSSAKVKFTANGVDFVLSSGVLLRATKNDSLKITVLHGSAQVTAMGASQVGSPGQEIDVPLGGSNGLKASGPPSAPITANVRPLIMPVVCSIAQAAGLKFTCWTLPPVQPSGPTPAPATVAPVIVPTVAA